MPPTPGPVPREALAYFRRKKITPSFDYRDVWREEHRMAFTVAKGMQEDILVDIRDALDDAIANGIPFNQFADNLRPILEDKGWWGRKDVLDPVTGETVSAQLGSPRRLRTIYSANVRSARAAGQWQRIQRTKATHPYLLYRLGPSENHRPEHASWSGILLPADDPWWKTHFPSNGWGCKCHVRQVSKAEYSRLAGTGEYMTQAPKVETRDWVNKRTGEVMQVPVGIDPGWDINPGAGRPARLKAETTKKTTARKKRLAEPLPTTNLYPAGTPGVLSTAKGVNQGDLEKAIASVAGNTKEAETFYRFMRSHPIKSLFIKASEMGTRNKAAFALTDRVRDFLGDTWQHHPRLAHTTRRAGRTNGFTHSVGEHVVVKVKADTKLNAVRADGFRKAIAEAVEQEATGKRTWSFSHQVGQGGDDGTRYLSTWIHEVGHQVHFWAGAPRPPVPRATSLTQYGRTNDYEWHAEHFVAWLTDRQALAAWNPSVAEYFDELLEAAINRGSK